MKYNRFEVWLVVLEPIQGSEMAKTRPCIIISPESINDFMKTVTIAPLTSTLKRYPFRVNCSFQGHAGQIALDHCRGVDKSRLKKNLGSIDDATALTLCETLLQLYAF